MTRDASRNHDGGVPPANSAGTDADTRVESLKEALSGLLEPLGLAGKFELQGIDEPQKVHICRKNNSRYRNEVCFIRITEAPPTSSPPASTPRSRPSQSVRIGGGYHLTDHRKACTADGVPPNSLLIEGPPGDRHAHGKVPSELLKPRKPSEPPPVQRRPSTAGVGRDSTDSSRVRYCTLEPDATYSFGTFQRGVGREKHGDRRQAVGRAAYDSRVNSQAGVFRVLSTDRRPFCQARQESSSAPGGSSDAGCGLAHEALDALLRAMGVWPVDLQRGMPESPEIVHSTSTVSGHWAVELCHVCSDRNGERIIERPPVEIVREVEKPVLQEVIQYVEKPVLKVEVVEKEVIKEVEVVKEVVKEVCKVQMVSAKKVQTTDASTQTEVDLIEDEEPCLTDGEAQTDQTLLPSRREQAPGTAVRIGGGFEIVPKLSTTSEVAAAPETTASGRPVSSFWRRGPQHLRAAATAQAAARLERKDRPVSAPPSGSSAQGSRANGYFLGKFARGAEKQAQCNFSVPEGARTFRVYAYGQESPGNQPFSDLSNGLSAMSPA